MEEMYWSGYELLCKSCKQPAKAEIRYEVHQSGGIEMIVETCCESERCPTLKEDRWY